MNVTNFVENFNSKIVVPGNGFHGEKVHNAVKTETVQNNMLQHEKVNIAPEDVKKAVDELNRLSGNFNEKVQFSLDDKTNRVIIKVMNRDTNEVISEIPGKYSIRLLEHFKEYMGLFIDESR
jgi:flagellar protein FlaG